MIKILKYDEYKEITYEFDLAKTYLNIYERTREIACHCEIVPETKELYTLVIKMVMPNGKKFIMLRTIRIPENLTKALDKALEKDLIVFDKVYDNINQKIECILKDFLYIILKNGSLSQIEDFDFSKEMYESLSKIKIEDIS